MQAPLGVIPQADLIIRVKFARFVPQGAQVRNKLLSFLALPPREI